MQSNYDFDCMKFIYFFFCAIYSIDFVFEVEISVAILGINQKETSTEQNTKENNPKDLNKNQES